MTDITSPIVGDDLAVVDDPDGTPLSRKINIGALLDVMSGDVTASTGVTVVADDSHNHVIANIDSMTSSALAGQISDETGTGLACFATSPTFSTSIIMGAATLNEAELEILDGATLTTIELNYVDGATSAIQTQLDAKEGTLTNEVGLYSALSDVTNFLQTGDATAGRSLTQTGDDVVADVELYTDLKTIYFEDPTAADDFNTLFVAPIALTITKIHCESDQTVNFDLQIDDGTPADVNGSDIACTTFATDSSLAGDTTMAAGDRLDLALTSVSGTPTWVSISWEFTYDD